MGYHSRPIERGVYGEVSKIREELEELEDAEQQGVTQLTFMKVELFSLASPTAMLVLTCDAARFMTREGGLLSRVETPEGLDLFCGGMEVGSYGTRTKFGLSWAYGTGLAEPRFSSALSQQKDKP